MVVMHCWVMMMAAGRGANGAPCDGSGSRGGAELMAVSGGRVDWCNTSGEAGIVTGVSVW